MILVPNGRHLRVQHTYSPVTSPTPWSSKGRRSGWGRLHPAAARRRGGGEGAWYSSRASPSTARDEEGEGSASTYPCRSLSVSVQENGVEGVVLIVIQITGDPSAERTAPPSSTHMQPGGVSHALIQQGEREMLGKTPSSSSTITWW